MGRGVIHQLVEIGWHLHPIATNPWTSICEHRPSDHKHISLCALNIAPGVLLYLVPCTAVLLRILRNHVCKTKALRHSRRRGHVPRRCHVSTAVSRALVVFQFGALSAGHASVGKKPLRPLLVSLFEHCAVQALCHEDRRLGCAAVEHSEGFIAKLAELRLRCYGRRRAVCKELRALGKACRLGR